MTDREACAPHVDEGLISPELTASLVECFSRNFADKNPAEKRLGATVIARATRGMTYGASSGRSDVWFAVCRLSDETQDKMAIVFAGQPEEQAPHSEVPVFVEVLESIIENRK